MTMRAYESIAKASRAELLKIRRRAAVAFANGKISESLYAQVLRATNNAYVTRED